MLLLKLMSHAKLGRNTKDNWFVLHILVFIKRHMGDSFSVLCLYVVMSIVDTFPIILWTWFTWPKVVVLLAEGTLHCKCCASEWVLPWGRRKTNVWIIYSANYSLLNQTGVALRLFQLLRARIAFLRQLLEGKTFFIRLLPNSCAFIFKANKH